MIKNKLIARLSFTGIKINVLTFTCKKDPDAGPRISASIMRKGLYYLTEEIILVLPVSLADLIYQ